MVIATRLHLGNASVPPSTEKIQGWIHNLHAMVSSVDSAIQGVIAVDAAPKMDGYDYVQAVRDQVQALGVTEQIFILPVTPWGTFVPALNALVYHAHTTRHADQILFVSAEVSVSAASILRLSEHCAEEKEEEDGSSSYVLVAGAALNGHLYQQNTGVLNGRTCPWNTLAIWNVTKLVLTGFVLVSDLGTTAGVEECAAVAVHQHVFPNQARAKLVRLEDVDWQDSFEHDMERRQWHERKMNSKLERAATQLQLLGLEGKGNVEHC